MEEKMVALPLMMQTFSRALHFDQVTSSRDHESQSHFRLVFRPHKPCPLTPQGPVQTTRGNGPRQNWADKTCVTCVCVRPCGRVTSGLSRSQVVLPLCHAGDYWRHKPSSIT